MVLVLVKDKRNFGKLLFVIILYIGCVDLNKPSWLVAYHLFRRLVFNHFRNTHHVEEETIVGTYT